MLELKDEFADEYLTKAIAANSMYENKYPLLSALSRPLLASKLVDIAHQYDAKYVAHGCTGKGNDQVRFEASILTLDPDLEVIAPVREWDLKSRPDEVAYAHEHGVPVPEGANDNPYSIDDNLWGRAIECGVLEDPWNEPPHDVWVMTKDPEETPDTPTYVDVEFEKGVPVALDGEKMPLAALVEKLNQVAGDNGYGRLDLMENRMVGLKSRECYEVPAALTLITAHKALEDLTLERDVLHQKLYLEQTWATCVYNGQWFSPLKKALDAFMAETQKFVTGTVRLKFFKGHCTVMGRKSRARSTITAWPPTIATRRSMRRPPWASSKSKRSLSRPGRRCRVPPPLPSRTFPSLRARTGSPYRDSTRAARTASFGSVRPAVLCRRRVPRAGLDGLRRRHAWRAGSGGSP